MRVWLVFLQILAGGVSCCVACYAGDAVVRAEGTVAASIRDLRSGDRLVLTPGVYRGGIDLSALNAGGPVTIEAEKPGQTIIDASGQARGVGAEGDLADVRLVGLVIRGARTGIVAGGKATRLTVDGCEIYGCQFGLRLEQGSGLVLRNTRLHDNEYGVVLGIKNGTGVDGVVIDSCQALDNHQAPEPGNTDGFVIEENCRGVVLRGCTAAGNGDAGFDIKPPALLERCLAYGNTKGGFKIWGARSTLINCIARGNLDTGVSLGGDGTQLWNCTIALNARAGVRPEAPSNGSLLLRNCIIAFNPNRQYGGAVYDDDYNLYYATEKEPAWILYGQPDRRHTISDLRARALLLGVHSVLDDPQFADTATADLHPLRTSPCCRAGVWSDLVASDFEGKPRRAGQPPDLGALVAEQ